MSQCTPLSCVCVAVVRTAEVCFIMASHVTRMHRSICNKVYTVLRKVQSAKPELSAMHPSIIKIHFRTSPSPPPTVTCGQ
ncbi:hypothetical protein BKA93DRAFT_802685 [Sparassis latifolia]